MSSSIENLKDPLTRLDNLPTIINWRGQWDSTAQYLLNDMVVSPANTATYILYSQTSISGGGDPSTNTTVWVAVGSASTSIQTLLPGTKIAISGSSNPTVTNNGVREVLVAINGGIQLLGTPQDRIIASAGAVTVAPGNAGISIEFFTPQNATITNQGTTSITPNTNNGLSVSVDNQNQATITNNGVLEVSALLGSGLTIDYPISPQTANITNNGLLSVTGGTGITTTQLNYEVEILNDGVRTLKAGYGAFVGLGPTIFPKSPRLTRVWSSLSVVGMTPTQFRGAGGVGAEFGIFEFDPIPGNLFTEYMANGPPTPTGLGMFYIDLSAFTLTVEGLVGPNALYITFVDTTTVGGPFESSRVLLNMKTIEFSLPQVFTLGKVALDIKAARTVGLRTVNQLKIGASTGSGANSYFTSYSSGDGWATFYPQNPLTPSP